MGNLTSRKVGLDITQIINRLQGSVAWFWKNSVRKLSALLQVDDLWNVTYLLFSPSKYINSNIM